MQLHQVNQGILSLFLVLGVLKITGLEAVESQKSKQDISGDYDDDVSVEPELPNTPLPSELPFFEKAEINVYATHEGDNVTITCQPKNFNESKHEILWYRNNSLITTGNTTLVLGDFALDTKFKLIVFNYTKSTPYHFACRVEPGHARQNVTIVFHPPDNISEHNAAADINQNLVSYMQVTAMTLVLMMTANAWN